VNGGKGKGRAAKAAPSRVSALPQSISDLESLFTLAQTMHARALLQGSLGIHDGAPDKIRAAALARMSGIPSRTVADLRCKLAALALWPDMLRSIAADLEGDWTLPGGAA